MRAPGGAEQVVGEGAQDGPGRVGRKAAEGMCVQGPSIKSANTDFATPDPWSSQNPPTLGGVLWLGAYQVLIAAALVGEAHTGRHSAAARAGRANDSYRGRTANQDARLARS